MGFLSDEQYEQISERLQSDQPQEPPSEPVPDVNVEVAASSEVEEKPEEQAQPEAEQATEATASEGAAKAEASDDGMSDDDATVPGHRVPYKRFQSVVKARNEYRDENDSLRSSIEQQKQQMEELRQQMMTLRTPPPQAESQEQEYSDSDLDALLSEDNDFPDHIRMELQALQDRIYQQEQNHEMQALESEISAASQEYSSLDAQELRQVLLHAVARDPSIDVMKTAEQYNTWKSSIEESAIAKYLENNPGASVAEAQEQTSKDTPPRPKSAGSGSAGIAKAKQRGGYKSLRQGSDALWDAVRKGEINLFG